MSFRLPIAVHCGLARAQWFGVEAFTLCARKPGLPARYFTPSRMETLQWQAADVDDRFRAELEARVAQIGVPGVEVETPVSPGPGDRREVKR